MLHADYKLLYKEEEEVREHQQNLEWSRKSLHSAVSSKVDY